MTLQPGKKITATHVILPITSQSKRNYTMKFGQLIEITREIFFFKKHVFLQKVCKKQELLNILIAVNLACNKKKLYKTLDY